MEEWKQINHSMLGSTTTSSSPSGARMVEEVFWTSSNQIDNNGHWTDPLTPPCHHRELSNFSPITSWPIACTDTTIDIDNLLDNPHLIFVWWDKRPTNWTAVGLVKHDSSYSQCCPCPSLQYRLTWEAPRFQLTIHRLHGQFAHTIRELYVVCIYII